MMSKAKFALMLGALPFAMTAIHAHAQDAGDSDASGDEIIVMAQKRSENLQDVPISIAAFTGQQLEQANISDISDLGKVASNITITKPVLASNVRIQIRGIGSSGNTGAEPSVASFVDGIYIPRPGSVINTFLDISGVEVLRGPQGTLFGRNASVGALSLRTATPENSFSARVTGEVGNGDRYKIDGYINVPISENVALRVAALGQWFGGYWHNRLDGQQFGGIDDVATRASLKAEFGNLTWIVRGDYSHTKGNGGYNLDFVGSSVSPAQLAALQARLGGTLPDTVIDDRNANSVIVGDLNDTQWGINSDLALDVNGFTLRMINSYRDWKQDQLDGDAAALTIPLLTRTSAFGSQSQNHELQFVSPSDELLGGRLDFVAGLYYFEEDYRIAEQFNLSSQFCNFIVGAAQRPACNASLITPGGDAATDQLFSQKLKSYAASGQATFGITVTLDLTLGGRWTRDEKTGLFDQRLNNPFGSALRAPEQTPMALKENRATWRASLNYKPTDDIMFFANYSTGYKSGGFNSGGGTAALGQRRIFGRETVNNYELGAKTSWGDGALLANLTFYRMDIGGYQDRSFDGVSFIVRNAGNLRQQGFELDTTIRPVRDFSVRASLAYLDSKFTDYKSAAGLPGIGGVQDLTGHPATFSPKLSGNLSAEWRGDIGSGLEWSLNSNLSFTGDYFNGAVNDGNRQSVQDGFAQLGARLTIGDVADKWSIAVFGTNLTNTAYCSATFYQLFEGALGLRNGVFPGSTGVRCSRAEPRTYGVAGTIRF